MYLKARRWRKTAKCRVYSSEKRKWTGHDGVSTKAEQATGYNILWGHKKDKLYHSYLVYGEELKEKRIGALIKDKNYYVRVDTFNENGITEG